MDELILSLGPAFASGFALQQLLEILDPVLDKIPGKTLKKIFLNLLSLLIGLVLAFGAGMRVLAPLGFSGPAFWDGLITALIISAGTEGFNSLMKFLGYAKENKKASVQK